MSKEHGGGRPLRLRSYEAPYPRQHHNWRPGIRWGTIQAHTSCMLAAHTCPSSTRACCDTHAAHRPLREDHHHLPPAARQAIVRAGRDLGGGRQRVWGAGHRRGPPARQRAAGARSRRQPVGSEPGHFAAAAAAAAAAAGSRGGAGAGRRLHVLYPLGAAGRRNRPGGGF